VIVLANAGITGFTGWSGGAFMRYSILENSIESSDSVVSPDWIDVI
jgi:hypothetical protein